MAQILKSIDISEFKKKLMMEWFVSFLVMLTSEQVRSDNSMSLLSEMWAFQGTLVSFFNFKSCQSKKKIKITFPQHLQNL